MALMIKAEVSLEASAFLFRGWVWLALTSELEKKIEEKDKALEDKDLRIEHLTELVLKRNKMLFGQKGAL